MSGWRLCGRKESSWKGLCLDFAVRFREEKDFEERFWASILACADMDVEDNVWMETEWAIVAMLVYRHSECEVRSGKERHCRLDRVVDKLFSLSLVF